MTPGGFPVLTQRVRDIDLLQQHISNLSSSWDDHDVLQLMDDVACFEQIARSFRTQLEAALIAYIQAKGHDLQFGSKRYYVGEKRTERPRVQRGANGRPVAGAAQRWLEDAVTGLMEAVEGDYAAFIECLSANAIKPAAARRKLEAGDYERLFETKTDLDLKTGKPKHRLLVADDRYTEGAQQ